MAGMELDPDLLLDFITESKELLEEYTSSLSQFEEDPQNLDTINPVFRAAHTLKGSSAFFGLTHIKDFAHKVENLLDEVRHKTREANREVIEFLFLAGNHLKDMFNRLSQGDAATELKPEEQTFLDNLVAYMGASGGAGGSGGGEADFTEACKKIKTILNDAMENASEPDEIIEQINTIISALPIELETAVQKAAEAGPVKAPVAAAYNGVDLTRPILSAWENFNAPAFDPPSYEKDLTELQSLIDQNGWDALKPSFLAAYDDFIAIFASGFEFDALLVGLLKGKFEAFSQELDLDYGEDESADDLSAQTDDDGLLAQAEQGKDEPAKESGKSEARQAERKTMRIAEEKVDGFMSYVGELIVTAESFNYLQKLIEQEKVNPNTVRAFKNANQAFRELSDELQESLMEIRRVPIKGVLQKVNMMARELSHQLGKKVRVQLEGQDVQLDKSIAESLEAPLVHVVRNSLDHGFEPTEDREKAGKSAECLLKVIAEADKEFFYLTVEDDGRGIDPDKMRQVAIDKGVLTESQAAALTEKEALALIFGAGFSTAKEVTDVSGRGVGMDVVRTNLNALNGSINVDSKIGQGTTITLKIPLSVTLQVIKALHVRVGDAQFIISLDDILESLRPTPEELSTVEERGLILNRRGQITPLIKLYEMFGLTPDYADPTEGLLVMVETSQGRYAILVDEVMGQQQVVVKDLGDQFKKLTFLAGSALLGDGGLGLVLDIDGVVRLALGLE